VPNRYAAAPAGTNPDPEHFRTSPDQLQARLADPATRAALRAQGLTDAELQALPQIYGLWIKGVGLEKNWLDRHPLVAKLLMAGAAGAPLAALAAPAVLGSGGAGAGTAGAAGTTGTGAAAALGPSTAASIGETSAIVGGSTVPASLAALTPAELATVGGAGAGGAAAASALGPSTPASMAETANVVSGGTVPASLSTGLGPVAKQSALSSVGNFLGSPGGGAALSAGLGLLGTGIAASGQTKAAEIQAQYLREALAYEKQRDAYLQQLEAARYGDISRRLEPYQAQATTTGDALARLLGVNPASYQYGTPEGAASSSMDPPVTMPTPMPTPPPSLSTPTGLPATDVMRQAATQAGMYGRWPFPASPPSGGTVLMRAPDGSTKQVPPDQVAHYTQRGAQIVSS